MVLPLTPVTEESLFALPVRAGVPRRIEIALAPARVGWGKVP